MKLKNLVVKTVLDFFDYFHKKKIVNFLKKKELKICFDVGAHHGETIEIFTKNFNCLKIYSFEPSIINYNTLEKYLTNNKHKFNNIDIKIFNFALGNKNIKEICIQQLPDSSSSTIVELNEDSKYFKKKSKYLYDLKNEKLIQKLKTSQHSIDSFIEKEGIDNVDLLKIDTEGYEFEVIKGAINNMSKINLIYFEHHYDDMLKKNYTFADINNFLKLHNFEKIFKLKMPFRKTFEYIYEKKK